MEPENLKQIDRPPLEPVIVDAILLGLFNRDFLNYYKMVARSCKPGQCHTFKAYYWSVRQLRNIKILCGHSSDGEYFVLKQPDIQGFEPWCDTVIRCAAKNGLERETVNLFYQGLAEGLDEYTAAWEALFIYDLVGYEEDKAHPPIKININ
jgi:hypothetical protein